MFYESLLEPGGRLRTSVIGILAAGCVALTCLGTAEEARAANSADVTATPQPSQLDGTIGVVSGNSVTYAFSINDGEAFSQTIPVQVCSENHDGTWTSYTFGAQTIAGPLPGVSATDVTFQFGVEGCQTFSIAINTGPLLLTDSNVAEIVNSNVNIGKKSQVPGSPNINIASGSNLPTIHIRVTVNPVAGNNVACYMTDSSGNFLTDANGNSVTESGSDAGTFDVVVNKKNTEVATNPGQFYFNLVWWNEGATSKTVSVDVSAKQNLVPQGRNAVHSAIFQGEIDVPNFSTFFDCANDGGTCYSTPHGDQGYVNNITIPPDSTLLVTYHLEWQYLRSLWPAGCPGGLCTIGVLGILTEAGSEIGRCHAGATGTMK